MFNNNGFGNDRTEWQSAATYTQEHVGYYLKQTRERFELSLERVSEDIRVRRVYLEAIEEGQYDRLPGTAYAVGFVRNYAKYLGLDAPRIVEQFRAESSSQQTELELEMPIVVESGSLPKKIIVIIGILLGIISIAFYVYSRDNQNVDTPAIVSPQVQTPQTNMEDKVEKAPNTTSPIVDQVNDTNTSAQQAGGLSSLPSNADGIDAELQTIEDLLGDGDAGENPTLDEEGLSGDIVINNYALPQKRGLEGWQQLNSMAIAPKPESWRADNIANIPTTDNNSDIYAPDTPVTAVADDSAGVVATQDSNNINSQVQPIGREPKIQLLATETSFIYVFKENGNDSEKELKIGRLSKGESYIIPEGEESFLLTFVDGDITAILDGKTEIPLVPTGGKPQLYTYESLKEQATQTVQ